MTETDKAHEYITIYTICTYKYQFLTSATNRGYDESEAELVWHVIEEMEDK